MAKETDKTDDEEPPASRFSALDGRTLVYVSLVLVVALGVLGVAFVPESTVNILGFCGIAITGLFTHLSTLAKAEQQEAKLDTVAQKADVVAEKAEVAAAKVEEVKETLVKTEARNDAKLSSVASKIDDVYHLANSGHRVQLELNAKLSRQWANEKPNQENEAAAKAAEKLLVDHDAAQAEADAKKAAHVQKVEVVSPEVQKVEVIVTKQENER